MRFQTRYLNDKITDLLFDANGLGLIKLQLMHLYQEYEQLK